MVAGTVGTSTYSSAGILSTELLSVDSGGQEIVETVKAKL